MTLTVANMIGVGARGNIRADDYLGHDCETEYSGCRGMEWVQKLAMAMAIGGYGGGEDFWAFGPS